MPNLATVYVRWSNRNATGRLNRILGVGLVSIASGTTWLLWTHRVVVGAALDTLQHHTVTIALLAGIGAAVVVSRQRSVHRSSAARSWVAALPMSPAARRVEALTLILAPIIATLALISALILLAGVVLGIAGVPASAGIVAWRSLLVGTCLGTVVALAIPPRRPVTAHPGSRYVPHRATRGRRPTPSVAALGIWPLRRMFAMLQPRTVSRVLLPVLLMVPMGSSAAAAMIWIGLFAMLAALVLFALSVIWVTQAARAWLTPLPISLARLGSVIALRAVLVVAAIGATATWLVWVGRS